MRRLVLASVALTAASLMMVSGAPAETATTICVPEASSKPVLSTNAKGECPTKGTKVPVKYKSVQLPGTGGLETLNKILPHVNYVESGIAGKPTIQFSGVNVQVVNGQGTTASVNGEGNLVIGYDENARTHEQTGSHDLILGEEQTFTSYGGIDAGQFNTISKPAASVTGGFDNVSQGEYASVSGGGENVATGKFASITGGRLGRGEGELSSISGGEENVAKGLYSWIGGGFRNAAEGELSSIFGGSGLSAKTDEACGGFPTASC